MMTIESRVNGYVGAKLDGLFRELATLRAENQVMAKRITPRVRGSKIVRRAVVDAHTVLMAAFSGDSTGCVAMATGDSTGCQAMANGYGVSRRRWEWAVAFLRYAGIVALHNREWRAGLTWIELELERAVALLEKAGSELIDGPDGYKKLRKILNGRRG